MARDSFRQPHYLRISIRRAFGIADIFKKASAMRKTRAFAQADLFENPHYSPSPAAWCA